MAVQRAGFLTAVNVVTDVFVGMCIVYGAGAMIVCFGCGMKMRWCPRMGLNVESCFGFVRSCLTGHDPRFNPRIGVDALAFVASRLRNLRPMFDQITSGFSQAGLLQKPRMLSPDRTRSGLKPKFLLLNSMSAFPLPDKFPAKQKSEVPAWLQIT